MESNVDRTRLIPAGAIRRAVARLGAWFDVATGAALPFVLGTLLVGPGIALATSDAELATNARLLASVRNDDAAGVTRALHEGAAVN